MMGLLYCAAGVTLAYAMALGTLEEQELYLLVVPSLIMISVGFTLWHKASHARPRSAARAFIVVKTAAIMATLAVVFGLNVKTGVQWLRQPDDGYARLLPYLAANVPPGTAVDIPAASLPLSQSEAAAMSSKASTRPGCGLPSRRCERTTSATYWSSGGRSTTACPTSTQLRCGR